MNTTLGKVASYINGYAFKPSDWKTIGLPIIRIQNLTDSTNVVNYFDGEVEPKYRIHHGDLLIAWSASIGVFEWNKGDALLNQHIFKVIFDKDIDIDKCYFKYQVEHLLKKMERDAHGATMKHLTRQVFESQPFILHEITEQRRIATLLSEIDQLKEKRYSQFELLSTLQSSRFIEMFGDPISNDFQWDRTALQQVTSKIGSGATPKGGKESYHSEGIALIRSLNVHDGEFKYKDLAHIDQKQADQLANVEVKEGDVLINITGASVARSTVVPKDILPARVNQHVCILRAEPGILDPVFLNQLLIFDSFKNHLLKIGESGGATRQAITKNQLENIEIIIPPIALQRSFRAFVHSIYKSKLAIQKSIDELEILKKKLMQEYFG